jgi:hypothetical protein
VAVAVSAAGFALAWWVCGKLIRLDEGVSLGIAGAVLAVLLALAAWWAPRDVGGETEESNGGRRLRQKARAGRDVYVAGRDMTINQRHRDE